MTLTMRLPIDKDILSKLVVTSCGIGQMGEIINEVIKQLDQDQDYKINTVT